MRVEVLPSVTEASGGLFAALSCTLLLGCGAANADTQRLPDKVYDDLFRLHLAQVANENCLSLGTSDATLDDAWEALTISARKATGLSYPEIAAIYESEEFDEEMQGRIERFLAEYQQADPCDAIDAARSHDPTLAKLIGKRND